TVWPLWAPISEIVATGADIVVVDCIDQTLLTAEHAEVAEKTTDPFSSRSSLHLSEPCVYAASNFCKVPPMLSTGLIFSFSSISSSSGGVFGAERSNSMASFQLIEPWPGQRWESRSLALSCTWVERMWLFRISNASVTLLIRCACPRSKHTPTSSKREV